MQLIDTDKTEYNKVIEKAVNSLKKGDVIVTPTDTIFGLSALASDKVAIDKIYKIKNRPQEKKFILLVPDLEMAKKYAKINSKQEMYLQSIWPGPVTVILEAKSTTKHLRSKEGSIAIRNPGFSFLNNIIKKLNCAIVSTSVNISGYDNLNSALKINEYFKNKENKPDLIIKGKSGDFKSSRIINIVDINNPITLRK